MGDDSSDGDRPPAALPDDALFVDDGPGSALTPMGQVDSIGRFARGFGGRRTKIALAAVGGVLLLLAVLAAVN